MIQESITIERVIELLNEMNRVDPVAMSALIAVRVTCNTALADHPTIQVRGDLTDEVALSPIYQVGPLGFLNGLFGVDDQGLGPIVMHVDDVGHLIGFGRWQGGGT